MGINTAAILEHTKTAVTIVDSICITVPFKPTPWKRPAGKSIRYDSQVNEKAVFAILVIAELKKQGITVSAGNPLFPSHTPLKFGLSFSFLTRKKIGTLDYPRADVDNLAKFVMDALQSQSLERCIWHDDDQVNLLVSCKKYGQEDSIFIEIRKLP